ncbi:MAG: hypothetical protein NVS1B11_32290 [Terriglobales bacterium]
MGWLPTGSEDVLKLAVPVLSRAPVPRAVVPDLKVTVPVGVPETELTVAVNVTNCPNAEGFSDEAIALVVLALLTF